MQLFVRTLQNGCIPVMVDSDTTVVKLKHQIEGLCGIPCSLQRLRCGTREIVDGTVSWIKPDSTVHILLRLVGGKGGFGSLLRVQGRDTKATTNFDACRDLSGRRLRDVNREKKLEDWKNKSKERELEDIALKFIAKETKRRKKELKPIVDSKTVSNLQKETILKVKEAVESSTSYRRRRRLKEQFTQSRKPRFQCEDSSTEEDSGESEVDEEVESFEEKDQPGKRKRAQTED
eukprot:g8333.t1